LMNMIMFCDKNELLIEYLKNIFIKKNITYKVCDISEVSGDIISTASNPDFTFGGGLDLYLKNRFKLKKGKLGVVVKGDSKIKNIYYNITCDKDIKTEFNIVYEAYKRYFEYCKTQKINNIIVTGFGNGIAELPIKNTANAFILAYLVIFEDEKFYKTLNSGKSVNGGDFDYSEYIQNKKKLPVIKNCKICKTGYHLTNDYKEWMLNCNECYECIPGKIIDYEYCDRKLVCSSFSFLKLYNMNIGKNNTGFCNSGDWNSGNRNSGDWNSGDGNSGDSNSGNWNSGNRNSGNRNSGDSNSGNWNSGDRNSGNRNSGDWNSGDWNSGYFNTKTPKKRLFNKIYNVEVIFPNYMFFNICIWIPYSNMTDKEKDKFPFCKITDGYLKIKNYKDAFIESFNEFCDEYQAKQTINLPNFDYAIFEEITGITKEMLQKKLGDISKIK
jgi:hypothetical protein